MAGVTKGVQLQAVHAQAPSGACYGGTRPQAATPCCGDGFGRCLLVCAPAPAEGLFARVAATRVVAKSPPPGAVCTPSAAPPQLLFGVQQPRTSCCTAHALVLTAMVGCAAPANPADPGADTVCIRSWTTALPLLTYTLVLQVVLFVVCRCQHGISVGCLFFETTL